MKITVFGTGYVGLVTGTCLAEVGHEVMCVDVDERKIENLKRGIIPIYEPGLEELVKRNFKEGRLQFTTDKVLWVSFWEAIFSAVGTPPDENHKADLRFVKSVAQTFWEHVNSYKVFINKSTVPVWTGDMCAEIIREEIQKRNLNILLQWGGSEGELFDIVSNPEFLKEWAAIKDFMTPDRIVCGISWEKAKKIMEKLYKPFVRTSSPIFFTDIKSSEIIKYAANAFLATKISFINEVANFAELVGANISDISTWIGLDERIGSKFLHAWIGYGGSCFPKDVQALIETGKEHKYDFQIISATERVNKTQKTKVITKLQKYLPELKEKTIALWGLSFKPKTDDIREAPSLEVIEKLLELGVGKIQVFDPVAMEHVKNMYGEHQKIIFSENNYEAIQDADALIILTEWDEFRMPNFEKISTLLKQKIIIDGRNIWNKKEMLEMGFLYEGIGK